MSPGGGRGAPPGQVASGEALISRVVERAAAELGLECHNAQRAAELALVIFTRRVARIKELTPGACRLVRVLAARRGAAVSKDDLAEACRLANEGVVRVYVCEIRKARPDLGRYIETIHGGNLRWTGPKL